MFNRDAKYHKSVTLRHLQLIMKEKYMDWLSFIARGIQNIFQTVKLCLIFSTSKQRVLWWAGKPVVYRYFCISKSQSWIFHWLLITIYMQRALKNREMMKFRALLTMKSWKLHGWNAAQQGVASHTRPREEGTVVYQTRGMVSKKAVFSVAQGRLNCSQEIIIDIGIHLWKTKNIHQG